MATALSNLLALLALDNSAYLSGLSDSQAAADSFGSKLSSVGGAVVLGGLTAAATAVVGVGTAAFDAAETLDAAFDKIATGTGATGAVLNGLQDDFKAVFASVPTDAESAATAISILSARLNISGEELQNLTKPMLEVSRIMDGDLTANAENFTRVIGDWSIPVGEASGSLDQLYMAAQSAGVPLDQLMERVVQYGAPMRNFGFSFSEAAALMAQWEAEGVNVEIVMSGMRIAQGKFIEQGVDMRTGLENTIDAILGASSATEGLAIATEAFGAKAAGDMFDTIMSGKFDIDAMTEAMQNANGAILETAASTADWPEIWTKFKNSMTLALAPMGDTIRAAFSGALDKLVEVFGRPDVQAAITSFANAAAVAIGWIAEKIPVVIDGIFAFVNFLSQNEGIVVGVFAALAVAAVAWGISTAAAAWAAVVPFLPVIGILLLVAAAVALFYEAWTNNWGGIRDKTMEVWGTIQPILSAIWTFISTNFMAGIVALGEIWTNTWQFISDFTSGKLGVLSQIFKTTWDLINANIALAVENIRLIYEAFMAAAEGDWYTFGAKLREVVDNVFTMIGNTLIATFKNIETVLMGLTSMDWEGLVSSIMDVLSSIPDLVRGIDWFAVGVSVMEGIGNGILSMIDTIIGTAMYAGQAILDALRGFFGIQSPSKLMNDMIGKNLGLGVIEGWEAVIQPTVLQPALANAATMPARSMGGAVAPANGSASGGGGDAMLTAEIRQLLRNMPNEIGMAVRAAIAKGSA